MSLETFVDAATKKIAKCGWIVINVFEDPERGIPSFSYTVGLSSLGLSELLMMAVPSNYAHQMLGELVKKMIAKEVAGTHLEIVSKIANLPVRLKNTGATGLLFTRFGNEYAKDKGRNPSVIHVEFPDQNGRFPGDPACDSNIARIQDLKALALAKDVDLASPKLADRPVLH